MDPSRVGEIIEDDQQLYDWGIENRLDQYYQQQQEQQQQQQQQQHHYDGYGSLPQAAPGPAPQHELHPQQQQGLPQQDYPRDYSCSQQPPPAHQSSVRIQPSNPTPPAGYYPAEYTPPTSVTSPASEPPIAPPPPAATPTAPPTPLPNGAVKPPSGPGGRRPMLPQVDMDANEVLKVERKRARNRVAASKCRLRKLERIAVLDQQAAQLRAENQELVSLADKLRSQVYSLRQELRWHVNNGCRLKTPSASCGGDPCNPDMTTTSVSPDSTSMKKISGQAATAQPSNNESILPPKEEP